MTLATEVYLLAPLIVLVAYIVYGVSGFGSTLIAVPLLVHMLPIRFVVPMVVLLDCAASLSIGLRFRAGIDRREATWILPAMFIGVLCGTWVLLAVSPATLAAALGALVTAYGVHCIVARPPTGTAPGWIAPFAGLAGGTMASAVGAGGPLYMMYLSRRITDKTRLRSTMSAVFAASTVVRIALFAAAGLFLQPGLLVLAALLVPAMFAGLWIGNRMHVSVSRETMMKLIGGLLVLAGLSLLRRAFG